MLSIYIPLTKNVIPATVMTPYQRSTCNYNVPGAHFM